MGERDDFVVLAVVQKHARAAWQFRSEALSQGDLLEPGVAPAATTPIRSRNQNERGELRSDFLFGEEFQQERTAEGVADEDRAVPQRHELLRDARAPQWCTRSCAAKVEASHGVSWH